MYDIFLVYFNSMYQKKSASKNSPSLKEQID